MEPESSLFSRRGGIEERFHSPETTGNPPAFPERLSLHFRAKGKVGKVATSKRSTGVDPPRPMGMYERFMLGLKIREQKLRYIEKDMMKDCTFAPALNCDKNVVRKVRKAPGAWKRFCGDCDARKVTPKKPNATLQATIVPRTGSTSCRTTSTTTPRRSLVRSVDKNSTGSDRIDKLYEDGLRKVRTGFKTDKEEEHARRQRFEELSMRQCTFKPRTQWNTRDVQNISPNIKLESFHTSMQQPSCRKIKAPPRKKMTPVSLFKKGGDVKAKIPIRTSKRNDPSTSGPYNYYDSPPL